MTDNPISPAAANLASMISSHVLTLAALERANRLAGGNGLGSDDPSVRHHTDLLAMQIELAFAAERLRAVSAENSLP